MSKFIAKLVLSYLLFSLVLLPEANTIPPDNTSFSDHEKVFASNANDGQGFTLTAVNFSVAPEESKYIEILASDFKEVTALQFTLTWDATEINVLDVIPNYLPIEDENVEKGDDYISITWHHGTPFEISPNEPLFQIFVEGISNSNIAEVISINSTVTEAVLYDQDQVAHLVNLRFTEEEKYEIELHQNRPNPFIHETTFDIELPEEMEMTISILDAQGMLIYEKTDLYSKGYNSILVDDTIVQQSGILFLKMEAAEFLETKKMIRIK